MLYVINNRDGSPRWMWNSRNQRPDFLRFYSQGTLRSKGYALLIRFLFALRLQHLAFRRNSLQVSRTKHHPLTSFTQGNFALFTGTAGPNRKLLLFSGQRFIKIALNEQTTHLIANEALVLNRLNQGKMMRIPEVETLGTGIIALSDIGVKGKRSGHFSPLHAYALKEMLQGVRHENCVFKETAIYRESLHKIENSGGISNPCIPANLQHKLLKLASSISEQQVPLTLAHRDFTPWNCYVSEGKVLVYDFELSHPFLPFGFDALHFVMQQAILVDRLPWKQIKPKLLSAFEMLPKTHRIKADFDLCLRAYLLIHIAYYLELYQNQKKWHTQIYWQLGTWNDALSDILSTTLEPRALLIEDLLGHLKPGTYAAVKFPDTHPASLSPFADLDLLTGKAQAGTLLRYLGRHSLVRKISIQRQSHMAQAQMILHNGQMLAVDLIWQLKRKALEFMDVAEAIATASPNPYGVYCIDVHHSRQYLQCFYGLNGENIPAKYLNCFDAAHPARFDISRLKKEIRALAVNKGLKGMKRHMFYMADVARRFIGQRGMVITFSGVDGAGKSTVIAHTRELLEKKLRRPVVVVRHRPSVLPILSAWTQGKEQAEKKAANTLPRQGSNQSTTGSLLRFTYYYTDYIFGQFFIYFNYTIRGKVVLYDRYYFDFINDSRRSNIRLPRWFTKAAYRLLMQPDINFFLYADADTILARKKELEAPVIRQLTKDYMQLFHELEAKWSGRYVTLENLYLKETLGIITAKAEAKFFGI